ncbi:MAG: serine hydrolase [Chloroflexi bacterium]|nr:serine hydrolase [Chloroflexota bacterium]
MKIDLSPVDALLNDAIRRRCPAAQLEIRLNGKMIGSRAYGWLDPETRQQPTQRETQFDLASVTKLFVVTAFMTLVEAGVVALDQPVYTVLPAFTGLRPIQPYENPLQLGDLVQVTDAVGTIDASTITFRHLLTHTSGLPAWRPLFRQADATAARQMALSTFFSSPTGAHIVYSDIGLILIGLAVEQLTGSVLADAVQQRVTDPLGLHQTRYHPLGNASINQNNSAPTEFCQWRQRRIVGEVHDENAARLGGVAGHAGLFSTAIDVATFGQMFLDGGQPLLRPETVQEMTRLQAEDGDIRRGLGFALWSPDPEASGNPFSQRAFGHTGFTGTTLWIDPARELVVALLTNDVYYGRAGREIGALRVAVHRAVVEIIDRLLV